MYLIGRKKQLKQLINILLLLTTSAAYSYGQTTYKLSDAKATKKTQRLFQNLRDLSEQGIMFGHEDDLAYGVGWWAEDGKSDVKAVVGDYPAVYGWDLGKLGEDRNIDSVRFDDMRRWIKEVYKRGGINTISWHPDNLTSGGSTWDKTETVKHILPGGKDHQKYLTKLDALVDYLNSLKSGFNHIPVIFRPFHEHNGDWFWWGAGNCTEEDYRSLWYFTVDYIQNVKQVHHLIYAYSPDASRLDQANARNSYLYGYPGDKYVDLLGIDDYWNVGRSINKTPIEKQKELLKSNLTMVDALAKSSGKLFAFTETGLESIPINNWYTANLLGPIMELDDINISYFLVWRNSDKKHHYAPYKGHPAANDFIEFYQHESTLFQSDITNPYKKQ